MEGTAVNDTSTGDAGDLFNVDLLVFIPVGLLGHALSGFALPRPGF